MYTSWKQTARASSSNVIVFTMSTALPRAKGACSCTTLPRKMHTLSQDSPNPTCIMCKKSRRCWNKHGKNEGPDKPCANEPCKLQNHNRHTHTHTQTRNAAALNSRATHFSLLESSDWKAICCYGDGLLPTRLSAQMHKIITIQSTWKPKRHRQSQRSKRAKVQAAMFTDWVSVCAFIARPAPPPPRRLHCHTVSAVNHENSGTCPGLNSGSKLGWNDVRWKQNRQNGPLQLFFRVLKELFIVISVWQAAHSSMSWKVGVAAIAGPFLCFSRPSSFTSVPLSKD